MSFESRSRLKKRTKLTQAPQRRIDNANADVLIADHTSTGEFFLKFNLVVKAGCQTTMSPRITFDISASLSACASQVLRSISQSRLAFER